MRTLLVLAALLLGHGQLAAQSCQQVKVATNAQKKHLLRDYIQECHQRHFLSEDKGAVTLVVYQDTAGRTCWLLSTISDDRYRTTPPAHYARVGNAIILVYQGTSSGNPLPLAGNPAAREACIREVLGGRVAPYVDEPRYILVNDAQGKPQKVKVTNVSGGNLHNDVIIRFNKNGTVSKLIPV